MSIFSSHRAHLNALYLPRPVKCPPPPAPAMAVTGPVTSAIDSTTWVSGPAAWASFAILVNGLAALRSIPCPPFPPSGSCVGLLMLGAKRETRRVGGGVHQHCSQFQSRASGGLRCLSTAIGHVIVYVQDEESSWQIGIRAACLRWVWQVPGGLDATLLM